MNVFKGSDDYVVTKELMNAVNVSIALQKPLLIKGEPGTGKTMLAESISKALDMDLIIWGIKSTTKAQEGLYVYDTVQRLYDSQFGEGNVSDIKQYIKLFEMDGIELKFEEDALDCIVDKAVEYKLGARGLRSIVEAIMMDTMFEIPSKNVKSFVVTLDYAKSQLEKAHLQKLESA